jgi:hypothetical protein
MMETQTDATKELKHHYTRPAPSPSIDLIATWDL